MKIDIEEARAISEATPSSVTGGFFTVAKLALNNFETQN